MRKFTNRLIAILFFLIPLASLAQTPVTGKVLDEKGKPVADASVLLKGAKSGTKKMQTETLPLMPNREMYW